MRWTMALVGLAFWAVNTAHAQDVAVPAPTIGEAIQAQQLEIVRHADGSLSGAGWDRLIEDGADAQFFLIGEQHATADIGEIATAMHAALVPHGYQYMAMEIGPWSTRYAEQLIRNTDDVVAAIGSAPSNGFSLPFLFFAEDARLAQQGIALSPSPFETLWGVDQEFIAGAPILAMQLETLSRTDAQRAAVQLFSEAAAADLMYLATTGPETYADLRAVFDPVTDAEAIAIIDAMLLSNTIYRPFVHRTGDIYSANLTRENYMKRNFLDHFTRIEARDGQPPRVFFKFGANHMMRGLSTTNVPALGNFLVEWGRIRNFGVVNIMIDCNGGESVDVRSGVTSPCQSYALEEDSLIRSIVGDQSLVLIDLRPLRAQIRSRTAIDRASRDLIFAFDYYLAVAEVEPATVIPPPMTPGE